jgi:hypothetical protein
MVYEILLSSDTRAMLEPVCRQAGWRSKDNKIGETFKL